MSVSGNKPQPTDKNEAGLSYQAHFRSLPEPEPYGSARAIMALINDIDLARQEMRKQAVVRESDAVLTPPRPNDLPEGSVITALSEFVWSTQSSTLGPHSSLPPTDGRTLRRFSQLGSAGCCPCDVVSAVHPEYVWFVCGYVCVETSL